MLQFAHAEMFIYFIYILNSAVFPQISSHGEQTKWHPHHLHTFPNLLAFAPHLHHIVFHESELEYIKIIFNCMLHF